MSRTENVSARLALFPSFVYPETLWINGQACDFEVAVPAVVQSLRGYLEVVYLWAKAE